MVHSMKCLRGVKLLRCNLGDFMRDLEIDAIKTRVINKVKIEYREYMKSLETKDVEYVMQNALKSTFYREMNIYIINEMASINHYIQMDSFDNILDTLWKRYEKNVIDSPNSDYMSQIIDLHINNMERLNNPSIYKDRV